MLPLIMVLCTHTQNTTPPRGRRKQREGVGNLTNREVNPMITQNKTTATLSTFCQILREWDLSQHGSIDELLGSLEALGDRWID